MFRRKLLLNLLILVICGTVAISIPVIVNHWSKPASANDNGQTPVTLESVFVDCTNLDFIDSCVVWQIYQKCGDKIVAAWDTIYASLNENPLEYDHDKLQLTSYGLCLKGIHTPADYQKLYDDGYSSDVTYQGQTCRLQLP